MTKDGYYLGIDIGTSKTAAVVLGQDCNVITAVSSDHNADVKTEDNFSEQDPEKISDSVINVIRSIDKGIKQHVCAVGLTGQMHGVVAVDKNNIPAGNFITWRDKRCLADGFIDTFSEKTGYRLKTGYGCATLAWLKSDNRLQKKAVSSCTIYDYIGSFLCSRDSSVIDSTSAASWGLFDFSAGNWDMEAAGRAGIADLLPEIRPTGSGIGSISGSIAGRLDLPASIPVTVGIGDNQASILAVIEDFGGDISLTLGTGGQISVVCPKNFQTGNNDRYEIRPFIDGRLIAVGACLSGGDAFRWLSETVTGFISELGLLIPEPGEVYKKLNELGLNAQSRLDIKPHFLGERYDEDLRASISNIDRNNMTLGNMAVSLAEGIMVNLQRMLPAELIENRSRVVASGNALRKNPLLAKAAAGVFNVPVAISEMNEEAACGAAVLSMRNVI